MSRPTSSPEADLNNPPNVFADWSAWGGFLRRLDMNPSINFLLPSRKRDDSIIRLRSTQQ